MRLGAQFERPDQHVERGVPARLDPAHAPGVGPPRLGLEVANASIAAILGAPVIDPHGKIVSSTPTASTPSRSRAVNPAKPSDAPSENSRP